ncbi:hypothetical protein [Dactylosporangium sp. NPDC049140]|jgi:hypothetical protein|uniref:hypothetical protein n=1 Tax=Dactylosporangium sp. NPDC049140 TaxID=3155647 RepID=UPI003406831D
MSTTMIAPEQGLVECMRPSTQTGDMALRMCRAERQIEMLTAVVRLLLDSATDPVRLQAEVLTATMTAGAAR